jgi:hypothetical protein
LFFFSFSAFNGFFVVILELQQLLRTEFNVPDSANIALDYHDRVSDRFCIVPVSAIRDLVLGSTSEISVRLHIYPKAEEHRHVNQVSNGDDARTENDGDTDEGFSISSVTSAVLATADSNRGAWENERYFGEYSKIVRFRVHVSFIGGSAS